ncbi:uncharacterized protein LOC114318690 [Camellia sinensis]|uniref:uncharacterized protein LOC114318690 n=1 Tax=Camellia sinensis TaxID=4442 RepID=UPI001035AA39|nr:uncharacterized protein LOC114318690 [Camellia sinensis]
MVNIDYEKARKFQGTLRNDILERVNVLKLPTYVDMLDPALMSETNMANQNKPSKWKSKRQGFFPKKKMFKKQNMGSLSSSSSRDSAPTCNICDRKHLGVCYHTSGACFLCGKTGHMVKDYPQSDQRGGRPSASSTGSIPVPRNIVRPTITRDTMRHGKVFALIPGDTQNTEVVVSGTITICSQDAFVLIDSGSSHSFVSTTYASRLNRPGVGVVYVVYHFCNMHIGSVTLYVDLLPLDIRHFNVIRGVDWLSKYCATIDCVTKQDIFRPPGHDEFIFMGNGVVPPPYLISARKACKLLRKRCHGYLCSVMTEQSMNVELDSIPIVREFPNIFPIGLLRELVDREIKFTIDIVSGTQPISKNPYGIPTIEMKELKEQLQDLLDKGFIRPSISPKGAPVLFVKKKDGTLQLCIDYQELNKNGKAIAYVS